MFMAGALFALKSLGLAMAADLGWTALVLLGFALSFSSTVFAVKVLEERSELGSLYGRIAVGILVMQDVFAVLFLSVTSGSLPSIWALGLVLLWPAAKLMRALLDRVGMATCRCSTAPCTTWCSCASGCARAPVCCRPWR